METTYLIHSIEINARTRDNYVKSETPKDIEFEVTSISENTDEIGDGVVEHEFIVNEVEEQPDFSSDEEIKMEIQEITFTTSEKVPTELSTEEQAKLEREERIRSFKARDYWEVHATFAAAAGEYGGRWFDENFQKPKDDGEARAERLWDEGRAAAIREMSTARKAAASALMPNLSAQGLGATASTVGIFDHTFKK